MGELISKMFSDTLWIYTAIAGALLGAAFLAWFRDTRMGLWAYSKFDADIRLSSSIDGVGLGYKNQMISGEKDILV